MSYADAINRISAIEAQFAAMRTGSIAPAAAGGVATGTSAPSSTSFSAYLAQAQNASSAVGMAADTGAALPSGASRLLTAGQQQFAARLASDTGLDPSVVSAWVLAEESGGAATSRAAAGNNDWLNIGYTDSATFGSGDSIWSDPTTAADATAGWLRGQNTIPGYGRASGGVQAILQTAGQSAATQVAAIQQSGWASSGYPDLPALLAQVGG
jgi:hypothetical protein